MFAGTLLALLLAIAPQYDLVIRNARIVDGTGAAWYRGDIAVQGDTIVAMAPRVEGAAVRTIDARDHVLAPGFIDLHTHASRAIFKLPTADNFIRQGVTTVFEGPDGSSPMPVRDFFARIEETRTAPNIASFVGQGSVRETVIGRVNRNATAEEIEQMKAIVRREMVDGAFGLSTGLYYVPGTFTPTEEVIALAAVAGELGGIHISHQRDETAKVRDSVKETIRIGEEGRLPTQATHMKVLGAPNWGGAADTLKLVDDARSRGVDVTMDQYPYTASKTSLHSALFPSWALEGGRQQMLGRLRDPAARARIREAVIDRIRNERGGGNPANIQIASYDAEPSLAGKTLAEITEARGAAPSIENAAETAIQLLEKGEVGGIYHAMSDADVERILVHRATMIASDGEVVVFGKDSPHPRSYGTFVRVLGRYVREKKLLSLEEAIRKMTSLPAARVGLHDRGILRPGMKADLVIFDPATVSDTATYANPHQYAVGVSHVIVNGVAVVHDGKVTGARPGKVLRHVGPPPPAAGHSR